jgi:hypothetical protein
MIQCTELALDCNWALSAVNGLCPSPSISSGRYVATQSSGISAQRRVRPKKNPYPRYAFFADVPGQQLRPEGVRIELILGGPKHL